MCIFIPLNHCRISSIKMHKQSIMSSSIRQVLLINSKTIRLYQKYSFYMLYNISGKKELYFSKLKVFSSNEWGDCLLICRQCLMLLSLWHRVSLSLLWCICTLFITLRLDNKNKRINKKLNGKRGGKLKTNKHLVAFPPA